MLTRDFEDFLRAVSDTGLTTAFVYFRFPDAPSICCPTPIVWQYEDEFPDFPRTREFIGYWHREIEGPLDKVRVAHCKLFAPAEIRIASSEFRLQ